MPPPWRGKLVKIKRYDAFLFCSDDDKASGKPLAEAKILLNVIIALQCSDWFKLRILRYKMMF